MINAKLNYVQYTKETVVLYSQNFNWMNYTVFLTDHTCFLSGLYHEPQLNGLYFWQTTHDFLVDYIMNLANLNKPYYDTSLN